MLGIVSKGIIIGILVSAPMGPVGMLCVQRTLNKGRLHGLVTGLGATLSDIVYAILTCLGMGVVVNFVEANQAPLQLLGSIVLGWQTDNVGESIHAGTYFYIRQIAFDGVTDREITTLFYEIIFLNCRIIVMCQLVTLIYCQFCETVCSNCNKQ